MLHFLRPSRLLPALLVLWTIATPGPAAAPADRPNLLVIQTDEHNFRTLGCYRALLAETEGFVWGRGIAVETPHIDVLARNGAIADRFYATSPVCTPSRAAFVSGRYPQNTGAIQNNLPLRDDVVTFGEVFRRNGYATGYAGKWHLEGEERPQFAPPRKFGFEDNRYMFNRGHWKKLELTAAGARVAATDARGQPTYAVAGADARSFTTDFLADRAIEFILAHRDRPFCYMLSIPDPHGPNTVRAPYDTMYLGLKFQPPASAQARGERLPGYAAVVPDRFNPAEMARYFGMVKCIDDNVGRIVDALRAAGLLERTVIVFTADHGDMCGEHGRHNKGIPLEGSARVPFIIHAPGRVAPGTVVGPALGTVDFKPTVLGLFGLANPSVDEGRDASRLFRDPAAAKTWDDISFVRIGGGGRGAASGEDGDEGPGWMGAFTRQYKFVVSPAADPALFDLEADPHELKNLLYSPAQRDVIRRLGRALSDYAAKSNEPHGRSVQVKADLDWAINGTSQYVSREKPATGAGKAGRTKAKKAGKAKAP